MSQSASVGVIGDETESRTTTAIQVTQSRSRKRSVVWKHFEDVGDNTAVCKNCGAIINCKRKSGTTQLRRHLLEICEGITGEERQRVAGGVVTDPFDRATWKFDPELTRNLIMCLFVDAGIPYSVIETRFWEPAMRSLNPDYKSVGRQTLRNDSVGIFKNGFDLLLSEFDKIDSRVSFTSDIWTSSVNLGYLCLTAHYIDNDFNLQKKIIAFKQMPYPHTGEAIAKLIEQILIDWKLDRRIFTLTLDNCSANDNAITHLERKLWEKTDFRGKHMHMRCTAHILNILVQDGMVVIQSAVRKIRELMRHITSYPSRLQSFNYIAEELKFKPRKGLILDCPTRWNSTFEMIKQALEYKEVLMRFVENTKLEVPTVAEWEEAELLAQYLEIFFLATQTFSTVRRPVSHLYVHEVWGVRDQLFDEDVRNNETLWGVSLVMQKKFDKYWKDLNSILTISNILDPRDKLVFLRFCFNKVYEKEVAEAMLETVKLAFKRFYEMYKTARPRTRHGTSSETFQEDRGVLGKRKLDAQYKKYKYENLSLSPQISELDAYLRENVIDENEDEDFDILKWWKNNSEKYPTLAKMARDFLAVPVATVASESAFSAAGRLTDHLRASMVAETLEALVCTKDWIGPNDGNFDLEQFRPFMLKF
ncbi:Zinc finger BED domain-containing protein DAYSLEEPER [Rhynchospora pubera]|uniref:Zinc finger BED domain-containing protein DAYSLEEPER n=1 Tax=Rhynchospora pubera TaxID=906938 RepID=A0AAV8HK34_9POAL|nr:Zinc finger BED domain-containing protein DAYSLEEPER [Rhynchospora pubera]